MIKDAYEYIGYYEKYLNWIFEVKMMSSTLLLNLPSIY